MTQSNSIRPPLRIITTMFAAALLFGACAAVEEAVDNRVADDSAAGEDAVSDHAGDDSGANDGETSGQADTPAVSEPQDERTPEEISQTEGIAEVDLSLKRDDIICNAFELGEDPETEIVVGHYVVDGNLGAVCFGEEDPAVIEAFEELALITPPLQMRDMALFGGFRWAGSPDDETLAYVTTMFDDDTEFVLAVSIDAVNNDIDTARLTNAHEFAHIITQTEFELDRSRFGDECMTYWNGLGCFESDSLMWAWMTEFWDPDVLASLDPNAAVYNEASDERCFIDDSYFGSYAATNPEEDFAEAFSAYVYGLEPATPGQAEKLEWLSDQPGLSEFRDRADDAGLTPLGNTFDVCG